MHDIKRMDLHVKLSIFNVVADHVDV
ncbi:hypothetical protein F383_31334 [Gossypium arboreum]|uniref:Uncharacterized protein n=1 Tax=Gossypium arboreum TaxID=29729 RepID=A0A0B0PE76_GOSAR|nr:hypothetical protein F383_31334 [Gossypium arboreum]